MILIDKAKKELFINFFNKICIEHDARKAKLVYANNHYCGFYNKFGFICVVEKFGLDMSLYIIRCGQIQIQISEKEYNDLINKWVNIGEQTYSQLRSFDMSKRSPKRYLNIKISKQQQYEAIQRFVEDIQTRQVLFEKHNGFSR
jgi:hypothetical protein